MPFAPLKASFFHKKRAKNGNRAIGFFRDRFTYKNMQFFQKSHRNLRLQKYAVAAVVKRNQELCSKMDPVRVLETADAPLYAERFG